MQLHPILIVAAVLAADGGLRLFAHDTGLDPRMTIALSFAPTAVGGAACWLVVRAMQRRLDRRMDAGPLVAGDRAVRWYRAFVLAGHFVAVLALGSLDAVRAVVGDRIFVDEAIAVLPPIVGLLVAWSIHYPLDRRHQRILMVRRLYDGRPIYPELTRGAYVLLQARVHLLLLLVPVLLILALAEILRGATERFGGPPWSGDVATLLAAVMVFAGTPLLVGWTLGLRSLPDGELRAALVAVCTGHGVGVRDLRLWPTNGTMINAAVMGLTGPLRFVILTDALLDSVTRSQLVAVMAHEIGHVRRHHMPWLIVVMLATLAGATVLVQGPLLVVHRVAGNALHPDAAAALEATAQVLILVTALPAFGWVSRRFERQADTFAVAHLSAEAPDGDGREPAVVTPDAVESMCEALATISELNFIDPRRPSWRHGSIAWRTGYLRTIVGRRIDRLAIDDLMRRIRWVAVTVLVASVGGQIALDRYAWPDVIARVGAAPRVQEDGG